MKSFFILIMMIIASNALAATMDGSLTVGNKGTLSFSSNGSFDINVTKGEAVQISDLDTLVISSPNGPPVDRTASDDVCYYATTAQYTIDMNSVNDYKIANGGHTKPYQLRWDDGKNGTDFTFTANSNAAQTFASNNRTSVNCQAAGGTNAAITVFIAGHDYNGGPSGVYTDTVNIILKAQ